MATNVESIRLTPFTEAHNKVLAYLKDCKKLSHGQMSQRFDRWNQTDKQHRSYIDVSDTDERGKKLNPFERQVYVPMSRAIFDTWMTYILQSVCGRRPMFPVNGRGPEDVKPAKIQEVILDYELEMQAAVLKIYRFGSDIAKYGIGAIKNTWTQEMSTIFEMAPSIVPDTWPPVVIRQRVPREVIGYEGPELTNTDPYRYHPDPRVPVGNVKGRQFTGYQYGRSKFELLKREEQGIYYNCKEWLPRFSTSGWEGDATDSESGREHTLNMSRAYKAFALNKDNPHYQLDEFWVEISPRELFGDSYPAWPQIWVFGMVEDGLIIRSEKSRFYHNTFPEVVAELDPDGYSLMNAGLYEEMLPLQNLMNWLYNSHITNVTKFLNDSIIFHPGYIEVRDLTRPTPAKLIRTTKRFKPESMRLSDVIQQLPFQDVTGSHLRDSALISDMMQRRAATPDTMQGIETEIRRTATEIAKQTSQAGSRLGMFVMLIFAQGLQPLAAQMVQNNQQFMSERRFYKIAGEYPAEIGLDPEDTGFLEAGPEDIQGMFNFPVFDGRLPIQPEERAKVIFEGLSTAVRIPGVAQLYDLAGLYARGMQDLGVKDIDRFRVKTNVLPDDQIAGLEERGDIIPMDRYRAGMQT